MKCLICKKRERLENEKICYKCLETIYLRRKILSYTFKWVLDNDKNKYS